MDSTSLNKIMPTESPGSSSSPDFRPERPTTVPMDSIEMTIETSTSHGRVKPNSISRPTTPIPATPVLSDDAMRTPIKRVLSLDLEMRSRKRRRGGPEDDNLVVYYSSPTSSLRLPNLIPLEDCCDSDITCMPDTSFLRQKKPSLLRRRRRKVV